MIQAHSPLSAIIRSIIVLTQAGIAVPSIIKRQPRPRPRKHYHQLVPASDSDKFKEKIDQMG